MSRYVEWDRKRATREPAEPPPGGHEVFICHKREDEELAGLVYEYLTEKGLNVFYSPVSIVQGGNPGFNDAIERALVDAHCLVAVATRSEHIRDPWPRFEWNAFQRFSVVFRDHIDPRARARVRRPAAERQRSQAGRR